jgi:hypothetical protein
MSETNDTSKLDAKLENRALAESELDAVTGGMLSFGDGRAATAPQSTDALTQMVQQLIQQISSQSGRPATG